MDAHDSAAEPICGDSQLRGAGFSKDAFTLACTPTIRGHQDWKGRSTSCMVAVQANKPSTMHIQSILRKVHPIKGFVYHKAKFYETRRGPSIRIAVKPRAGSKAICHAASSPSFRSGECSWYWLTLFVALSAPGVA
jgi:hypothetical protein